MTGRLRDLWLPEVEAEYRALLSRNRDVGADVGNQFRAFEQVLRRGVDDNWRPIDHANSADIYVMYARYALMFFAVQDDQAAIVKWTVLGSEYEQNQAREEARRRAGQIFP
jgi:hypothetical protein